jgi:hypothetical protein
MRIAAPRVHIRTLLAAVAVVALLLASFGPQNGPGAIVSLLMCFVLPFWLATPTARAQFAIVSLSLAPLWTTLFMIATWFAAWAQLGHRPKPSIDDPKSIHGLVDLCYGGAMFWIVALPGCVLLAPFLSVALLRPINRGRHPIQTIARRFFLPAAASALSFVAMIHVPDMFAKELAVWFLD